MHISVFDMSCSLIEMERDMGSFAVLDLEANGRDYRTPEIDIIEMCIYGFAAKELDVEPLVTPCEPPESPRIVHKLTLLFKPCHSINTKSGVRAGITNDMLEDVSDFNERAANMMISFLLHLQQPVCLVAHNGYCFDFPIIKYLLNKLSMQLPESVLCVDSLRAFLGIDEQLTILTENDKTAAAELVDEETLDENTMKPRAGTNITTDLPQEQALMSTDIKLEEMSRHVGNEITPERSTSATMSECAQPPLEQRYINERTPIKTRTTDTTLTARRALFSNPGTREYPPIYDYRLGKKYAIHFGTQPVQVHWAEADVNTLMKLIQAYGVNFLAYAKNHAIPFSEIKDINSETVN